MDPLNLILLIVVIFIGLRLRSVLGMRDEDETPSSRKDAYRLNRDAFDHKEQLGTPPAKDQRADEVDVVASGSGHGDEAQATPPHREEEAQGEERDQYQETVGQDVEGRGLAFLRDIEPDFDEAGFLDGAGRAYEMILTAFADGDLSSVRGFLGDDVAGGFDGAIAARQEAGQQLVTRILRLDRPALDDARIEADAITLDVRFRAELISFTCAQDAAIDEDALPAPATAHDVWSFARARHSSDPNWTLVATHSA